MARSGPIHIERQERALSGSLEAVHSRSLVRVNSMRAAVRRIASRLKNAS